MSINIPPDPKGSVNLKARVYVLGAWRECLVIDADAAARTARLIISGSLVNVIATFSVIQNVALVYDDGTVLKSFGAPRVNNPASLEYIQYLSAVPAQVDAQVGS